MNQHGYPSEIDANRQLFLLPDAIYIQAAPLPVHPIFYNGIQVPQFSPLTQVDSISYTIPIHHDFGPYPLPNDHPAVPYPAEEGMQWIGYLAPNPGMSILMNTKACQMNTYDINGQLYAPSNYPSLTSTANGFPHSICPFQPQYQEPTINFNHSSPILTGCLSGSPADLQNSTLNNGTGQNDPPIANPTAQLVVVGYLDENTIVAMERRRALLFWNAIPHPQEVTDYYCEEVRMGLGRMRPIWVEELSAGLPLTKFGLIENAGMVGSPGAGAANEEIEEQNGDEDCSDDAEGEDDDMDYDG